MKRLSLSYEEIYSGDLILVNRKLPYRGGGTNGLVPVSDAEPEVLLERRAAELLNELMRRINGWKQILAVSGWRSQREQQEIWDDTMNTKGEAFTRQFVAYPGHSEHQTGLAIDLGLRMKEVDFICPEFPYSGICRTFRTRAADYGFVCRYPAGKENITGIAHEPWHFRYVGIPHARAMVRSGLTLEEYITELRNDPRGKRFSEVRVGRQIAYISYVRAEKNGRTEIEVNDAYPYEISGNNADGFVVTEWRRENGSGS